MCVGEFGIFTRAKGFCPGELGVTVRACDIMFIVARYFCLCIGGSSSLLIPIQCYSTPEPSTASLLNASQCLVLISPITLRLSWRDLKRPQRILALMFLFWALYCRHGTVTLTFYVSQFCYTQRIRPNHSYESYICRVGVSPIFLRLS